MNDVKNNWFYKHCAKNCAKDLALVVVGFALIAAGLLLFLAVISVLNIALAGVGVFLVAKGMSAVFIKLPKLKEQMNAMTAQEFASLGTVPPQQMAYSTFYLTDRYLCAPSAYALMRLDTIKEIHPNVMTYNGRETGVFLNFEFKTGRAPIDVTVKDWGTFKKDGNMFIMQVYQKRQALENLKNM